MNVNDLLLFPRGACNESEQRCPLLRMCPVCWYTFVATRNRRQHQTTCKGHIDTRLADAQHDHLTHVHRVRTPRRTSRRWSG